MAPLVNYLWSLHETRPDLVLTVILPDILAPHWWQIPLQSNNAERLRQAVRPVPNITVTTVPFHLPATRGRRP